MLKISVVICTHNPRTEYLNRVIDSLKQQTLPASGWEILLIDNKSDEPLSDHFSLAWHPNGRHIVEEELGLTPARIRGILEAQSELILFVDDDNCLDRNYLAIIRDMMSRHDLIGVLGAGKIIPEFECAPSPDVLPYVGWLALRDNNRAHYSNQVSFNEATPLGAGLCIRKEFAVDYVDSCKNRALASTLDRTGTQLLSGGDVDMALHACRAGKLAAVIPELRLLHLIPASRLQPDYLVRLMAGHAFSLYVLARLWNYAGDHTDHPLLQKYRYYRLLMRYKGLEKRIFIAQQEAIANAMAAWAKTTDKSYPTETPETTGLEQTAQTDANAAEPIW